MTALRNWFRFSGRFNRDNYWIGLGICFVMIALAFSIPRYNGLVVATLVGWIVLWGMALLATVVKRLRDLSGGWSLLFLTLMAVLIGCVFLSMPHYALVLNAIGFILLGTIPGTSSIVPTPLDPV
jgi:uncharacterized membrane protein YhaH (DUF805 family)